MRAHTTKIAWWCYGLLAAAWVADMLTPQLFVVAIVLNAPIALSSVALRRTLTIQLVVAAEAANIVAGYWNGVAAGYHWDAVGVGDRMLTAASFVLVGTLVLRAQRSALAAGQSAERERQAAREGALRRALDRVRTSLNVQLILRAAVREALHLVGASRATAVVREDAFAQHTAYVAVRDCADIEVARQPLEPAVRSLIERSRDSGAAVEVGENEPIGRLLQHATIVASLGIEELDAALVLDWGTDSPGADDRSIVEDFADGVAVALRQAQLFRRLSEQNDEIAQQRNDLQARADIIRDIVYALAHDLRTPLLAVDTTMHQALDGAYGELPQRYRRVLETSLESNETLRRLVETLLLVARFESGEDSHAVERVDVAAVAERVAQDLHTLAERKNVQLTVAASGVCVDANADEVRRAIINLAGNALEATPAGGHVSIATRRAGTRCIIAVSDDGYGVAAELRASLFERFGGVRGGKGTGLGLYIVARIAEKYGGRAAYEPLEPRGSRFTIEFPAVAEGAA